MEPIFKRYKNSEVDGACKWTLTLVKRKGIVLFTKKIYDLEFLMFCLDSFIFDVFKFRLKRQ